MRYRLFPANVILSVLLSLGGALLISNAPPSYSQLENPPAITSAIVLGDKLVVSICGRLNGCRLVEYLLVDSKSNGPLDGVVLRDSTASSSEKILRGPGGNSIIFDSRVFDLSSLTQKGMLPTRAYIYGRDGESAAYQDGPDKWCVVRISEPNTCYARVTGQLLAIGFHLSLTRQGRSVFLNKIASGEKVLLYGSASCPSQAEILSSSLFAISDCNKTAVLDSTGATKLNLDRFVLHFDNIYLSDEHQRIMAVSMSSLKNKWRRGRKEFSALMSLGASAEDDTPNQSRVYVYDLHAIKPAPVWNRTFHYDVPRNQPSFAISEDGKSVIVATIEGVYLVPVS